MQCQSEAVSLRVVMQYSGRWAFNILSRIPLLSMSRHRPKVINCRPANTRDTHRGIIVETGAILSGGRHIQWPSWGQQEERLGSQADSPSLQYHLCLIASSFQGEQFTGERLLVYVIPPPAPPSTKSPWLTHYPHTIHRLTRYPQATTLFIG